jgi:CBS domain-containing protein
MMRISELMQTDVQTVAPDAVVQDAAVVLADAHVSALAVVDSAGRMVGVISRTDILASEEEADNEEARAALFEETLVRDLMTSPALTIPPDADIKEAAQQLLHTGVHHLFVTAEDRVVGVISTTDIVRAVAMGRL